MDRKAWLAAGVAALYFGALAVILVAAPQVILEHVLVYVFFILFMLVVLGGSVYFDLQANTSRDDDPSMEQEAETFWPSPPAAFVALLFIMGTLLLLFMILGTFARFPA